MTAQPWQHAQPTYRLTLTYAQWQRAYVAIYRWSIARVAVRILRELTDRTTARTPGDRPLTLACTAFELAVIAESVAEDGPIARAVRAIAPRD